MPGYKIYHNNRKAVSRYRSGGITLLVKDELSPFVTVLKNESKLALWFSISKTIMQNDTDLICGIIYIPPIGSKFAHQDPYLELQNEFDIFCSNSKNTLLFGDYNSRTASHSDFVRIDNFICDVYGNDDLLSENLEIIQCFDKCHIPLERKNIDTVSNAYGQQLIEFCKNNNIFMLNGRLDQEDLKLTCKNKSTVDYFLSSAHNFEIISSFKILDFDCLFSDAHCPLSVEINRSKVNISNANARAHQQNPPDINLWDESKRENFVENIDSNEITKINTLLNRISANGQVRPEDINEIISTIENLFTKSALLTFGRKYKHENNKTDNIKKKRWFNTECHNARNAYHVARKLYNKFKTTQYKNQLKIVSREYKAKMKKSYTKFQTENISKLRNLKNAKPREFWTIINALDNKKRETAPLKDLFDFFKNINSNDMEEIEIFEHNYLIDNNETINNLFTEEEILKAVKKLKNNKSNGIDKILNEHIKSTIGIMCPIYVKLFNMILDSGIVPESLSLGDILPIYKNKGSIHQPENYRPITLLSCFGKLFTAMINSRISSYFEENQIIDSCQAGFRKGFSTTDNLFIIQSLVEIAKGNKNKLFCAFVDFKQAFDTVWRGGLWQKMFDSRINGKCFEIIKNMYSNIKSRISTAEGSTVFFPCQTGVRQGENLSPLLFSVFLNDLRHYLCTNGAHGVMCDSDDDENINIFIKLFVLLFADDAVLFSSTKEGLQTTLNVFNNYCITWKLTVNTNKTKVMIFSNGRQANNLKFYLNGAELEIVSEYKYLGIFLARSGAFAKAKKTHSGSGKLCPFFASTENKALKPTH